MLIARRQNGRLKPFDVLRKLNRRPTPQKEILDAPNKIAGELWVTTDFLQLYPHPTPYPRKLAPVCENDPYTYGTAVSNLENAELTTLLDRIKTAHPYEDFITIGPTKSKDILSDPLISKAYCLIYNIMQRCTHAKDHDTYILDIRKNALGLIN